MQKIVIMNVSNTIDAQTNKWWQTVEGEWLGDTKKINTKGATSAAAAVVSGILAGSGP